MDGVGEGIIGGNNLQPLWFKEDHADSACQRKQIDGDDRRAEDDGLLPLKKSPDSDAQPAAEQRAKRDDEEGAQPVEAFWSRPAEGRAPHQHNHPENGCRDKTGQRLPNNDGPVTDGGEQELLDRALLPLQGRGQPAGNHAARGDQQQDRRQHRILEQRDVLWTQRLLRNADADGTRLPLRLIVSDDGVRDGSPDIVGEIEIEVVDLYQERRSLVCLHAPGEIRRDGDDGSHVELPVEGRCLLRVRDADAKHLRVDDGLNDLRAGGATVEIDDGDGTATDRCCTQVLHQQIGERDKQGRDDQDPHAEPDAQILFANLPHSVHESSHVSFSSVRDPAEAHCQRCAYYKAERKTTQYQAVGEQAQRIGGEPFKGKLLEHDGIVHWKQPRDLLHCHRGKGERSKDAAQEKEWNGETTGERRQYDALFQGHAEHDASGNEYQQREQRDADDHREVGGPITHDEDQDSEHRCHWRKPYYERAQHFSHKYRPRTDRCQEQFLDGRLFPFAGRTHACLQETRDHEADHQDRDRQERDVVGLLWVGILFLWDDRDQLWQCPGVKRRH